MHAQALCNPVTAAGLLILAIERFTDIGAQSQPQS